MQYLNFVSKKIFFSAVSIYSLLFLQGFLRSLINCLNSKRSHFSFITAFFLTSTVFTFFTSTENPFIYFKNQLSFVFSQSIISEYANKFSRKGTPQRGLLNIQHKCDCSTYLKDTYMFHYGTIEKSSFYHQTITGVNHIKPSKYVFIARSFMNLLFTFSSKII